MPRLRTPGPGSYELPGNMTIGGSMGGRPTASFASNSKRSSRASQDAGGDPVAYDIEKAGIHLGNKEPICHSSKRSFNRDVGAGRGSFNSSSARSSSKSAGSQRGGPGENDYSHMYSCGNASTQVTSSFLSAMPLGGHVRKSSTPGVGEYEPEKMGSKNHARDGASHMFAGGVKSRSMASSSASGTNVGPGSYDLEAETLSRKGLSSANPRLPAFGSSSVRMREDE